MRDRYYHWEIKGRFRKRVVLANVPSFRFSFRGNIRRNHPFGNHPFVNTKKGHWEIKGRFPKGWFWRTYPRSGFRSGGTSAKTTLLETTLLRTPDISFRFLFSSVDLPLLAKDLKHVTMGCCLRCASSQFPYYHVVLACMYRSLSGNLAPLPAIHSETWLVHKHFSSMKQG